MGKIITWTEPAKNDIKEITLYWNNRNKSTSYSIKLRKIIQQNLKLISQFPLIGKDSNYKTARLFIINEYKLFYEVTNDSIIILRIWNTNQNPDTLKV